jgi:microcystin-dependent protein
MGAVWLVAGHTAGGVPATGQTLNISQNAALFSLLGNLYGGDGMSTFKLPDLRNSAPNGLTYVICTQGVFPSRS